MQLQVIVVPIFLGFLQVDIGVNSGCALDSPLSGAFERSRHAQHRQGPHPTRVMFNLLGRSKTLRPLKALSKDSRGFKLSEKAQASLGTGNMRAAVQLPPGEDLNEWLAVNTVDFFNETSLIYGTILEICSEESCPVMSAGELYQYYWMDGVNVKTPVKVSAPQYVDYLMTWVDSLINDESIFPLQSGRF